MVSSALTMSARRPVSSSTSRRAAASEVSPGETAPLGSPQRVLPRVAMSATYGTPSRTEITAPPDEYSLRVFGGIWGFYRVTFGGEWRRIFSVHITPGGPT